MSQRYGNNMSGGWGQNNGFKQNSFSSTGSKKGWHPNQDIGKSLRDVDWSRIRLDPFTKVFYKQGQSKRSQEEIDEYRQQHEIQIVATHGNYMPFPFISWEETYFPPYIMQEVINAKFPAPTAIQSQSFPIILSGHDLIGIAKTGSGKTLSFLLPSVVHINAQPPVRSGDGPIVLVLAPTRELAVQIQDECHKFGSSSKIKSCCVYGGADKEPQKQNCRAGMDIVIATPGRLIDFIEKGITNLRRVTYLVLDEADRMLDMGFEPQIRQILGQIRPDRQTLMFSATWPKEVQRLATECCQNLPIHIQIGSNNMTINKNIRQITEVLGQHQKLQRTIKYLDSMQASDKVLIFTSTKKNCDNLTRALRGEQFPALAIHGDKTQDERDKCIEQFKQDQCKILIATDVAQRGLDIKNITFVINYDFPRNIEDYVHRIGRTGRANAVGTSISFLTFEDDKLIAISLIDLLKKGGQDIPEELYNLGDAGQAQKRMKNQSKNNNRYGGGGGQRNGGGRSRSRSPERGHYNGSSFRDLKQRQNQSLQVQQQYNTGYAQQQQTQQYQNNSQGYANTFQPPQPQDQNGYNFSYQQPNM